MSEPKEESSSTSTPPTTMVSQMAEHLVGSEIIKLAAEVQKASGTRKIYNYTIGDFDPKIFPIPAELKAAIVTAYENDETNYPAANGILELRQAVSQWLLRSTNEQLNYPPDQILIAGGARPLLYAIYQTIVDPGDTIVFPVPSWNNNHYTHLSRGIAQPVETTAATNFMPTAADLEPYISKAALISLCSPLNPTGTVFTKEGLYEICDLIVQENKQRNVNNNQKPLYLIFDQIYWTLTHGDTIHYDPVTVYPEMKEYTIYIDGISKAFCATGVRVGWAMGPKIVIQKMTSICGHVGAWAPKAEQVASALYLQHEEWTKTYLASYKEQLGKRLNAFYNGIMVLKKTYGPDMIDAIPPQAAIYLTVKFDLKGKKTSQQKLLGTTEDVTQYLLDEAGLAIVPFYAFGTSRKSPWYRLSVGTSVYEDIDGLFEILGAALAKLT